MEKTTINTTNNIKNENISLENRNKLTLSGIQEIVASSENQILVKLKDTSLSIYGNNINITRLDIDTGSLTADGNIEKIIYGKTQNLFKRIFK